MNRLLLSGILLWLCFPAVSQIYLTGAAPVWIDDAHEWELFTEDEELVVQIVATWHHLDDYSQWDYRVGEDAGTIRQKWPDNPNEWELRGNNQVFTARTVWRDDFREWRITDNTTTLVLKTRWGDNLEDWWLGSDDFGGFEMYTAWEGDLRDWNILDGMDESISQEMKIFLAFLCLYHAVGF